MKTIIALPLLVWMYFPVMVSGQFLSFDEGLSATSAGNTYPERTTTFTENSNILEIDWQFAGAHVSDVAVKDELYQYLHIDGFSKLHETGNPALPCRTDRVAMPPGSIAEIELIDFQFEEYEGFVIHPALRPARDTEGAPEPEFEINEALYSTNAFYPESPVKLKDTHLIRGIPVAMVQTIPVLFNPVTGKVRVYTRLTFQVKLTRGKGSFESIATSNSRVFTNNLKKSVINPESLPDGISGKEMRKSKDGAKNYIIVTHEDYNAQVLQLANWKRQLGYSVEIISGSNWTSEQIKSEIQNRYDFWDPKPDYVLIFGDHTGAGAVPGEIHQDPYYSDNFATDLYYLCMDGESDWHPDLAGGRISVSSVAEAQVVVDKIINYEKNPVNVPGFYENAITCAQYQDDDNNGFADRRFCHTSEEIFEYLQSDQKYIAERIYYTSSTADVTGLRYNNGYYSYGQLLPSKLRTSTFDWRGGSTDITDAINSGKFLVFHRDHGYVGGSGWAHPFYTTSSMNSLNNGSLLPVVFSINCHTGEFQLNNCFAEKLVRMEDKGAIGVVAAAYYSFSGFNDALAEGMIDAIWPEPGLTPEFGSGGSGSGYTCGSQITTMGDVVRQGLYAMEVNWGGSSSSDKYQYELFHWFGDPAMKIWTSDPYQQVITANHTGEIDCAETSFTITGSVPEATVTLVFNDELIAVATTNSAGDCVINYDIQSPGASVVLTVSKNNHKPYVAVLNVVGSCSFPPAVNTFSASAFTTGTAMVGGEITNDFGSEVNESGIIYSLSPHPVSGGNGVLEIQTDPTIPAGSFELEISGLDPDTRYYYRAFAVNGNGIGYGNEMSFVTLSESVQIPYSQYFENAGNWPEGWSTDNDNVWSISSNWNGINNPGGYHVFSDYYPYETGTVYTPFFDGSGKEGIMVEFYHYWRANYSSGDQHGYFYGSRDGGQTFPYLIDEWHHNNPGIEEGEKVYDISSWADGYEGLAFKWVVTHNNDWYWEFDNFEIYEYGVHGLWTGNHSTDWNDPGNWHDGLLPDAFTDVVIPSVPEGVNFPEINNGPGAVCHNLTIEDDARLFVPHGNSLTVEGNLVNHAGVEGLVIKSGQGGITGSLIQNSTGVEASVEQYLTQLKWHLLGIPVKYAEAGVFFFPGQSEIYLNGFIESTSSWGPWIVSVTTPLELGRGYECWVSDNVNQDETIVFQGVLNAGEFTTGKHGFYPLGYTPGHGFNQIGRAHV